MAAINFPALTTWAFNPNYITIEGASASTGKVTVGNTSIDIALFKSGDTYSTKVYISRLLQLAFTSPLTTRSVNVGMSVSLSDDTSKASSSDVLWGSIEVGDRFAHYGSYKTYKNDEAHMYWERHIQYFVNFPQRLDLMVVRGETIKTQKDNGDIVVLDSSAQPTSGSNVGFKSYLLGSGSLAAGTRLLTVYQNAGTELSTFDDTFDATFHYPGENAVTTKLVTRNDKEGYFLRWVDRFGCMQYYLFVNGDKTLKTTLSSYNKYEYNSVDDMYYGGYKRNIGATTAPSVKVCADNLDMETLSYVESIISSPYIDLFKGYGKTGEEIWQPVQVEGNSYSYKSRNKIRQNFEITLVLPERVTQSI